MRRTYPRFYTFNDRVETIIDSPFGLERVCLSRKLHQARHNRRQEGRKRIRVELQTLDTANLIKWDINIDPECTYVNAFADVYCRRKANNCVGAGSLVLQQMDEDSP